ncbi:MAG TPA: PAS domain S-box protein [bacterium]|nr:PAS domain S-box protein [bacterium]
METHAERIRTLELITRRATDAYLVVSADRTIESANPAASLLFGVESAALRGTPISRWTTFTGPLDRPLAAWETEVVSHTFDRIPVELAIIPIDDGGASAWVVLRDVTRRRGLEGSVRQHAEELERMVTAKLRSLDDLHRRYRSLYDMAPILDFEIDSQGAICSANRKAFLSIGVAIEKLVGVPISDLVIPSKRDAFRSAISKARAGSTEPIETNLRSGDGSALDIIFHAVHDDVQRPGSLRLLGLDVTSHRESERLVDQGLELAEAQRARMERILRGVAQGIAVMDADGQIRLMNAIAERLLSMEEKWAFGRDLFKEHEDSRFAEEWSAYVGGKAEVLVSEFRAGGPQGLRISCAVSRIRTPEGRPAGFVALLQDRTQERRAQESRNVRWRETLEEMRAPVTAITSFAPSLLRAEGLSDETQNAAALIHKEAQRLGDLLEDIQTLSRLDLGREGLNLRRGNFARLLKDALAVESPGAGARAIRFDATGLEQECSAQFDAEMMRIVLHGILQFALRLTFDGRSIEVRLKQDEHEAVCAIRTAGRAISQQELDVIGKGFEAPPAAGPATERGLTLARRIIQLHGGDIELENLAGGASIRVTIPCEEIRESLPQAFTSAAGAFTDALVDDPDEAGFPLSLLPPAAR